MRATVRSAGVLGMDAYTVEIEVEVAFGLPSYHVVGLPACAVKEGGVRVRSALEYAGHELLVTYVHYLCPPRVSWPSRPLVVVVGG